MERRRWRSTPREDEETSFRVTLSSSFDRSRKYSHSSFTHAFVPRRRRRTIQDRDQGDLDELRQKPSRCGSSPMRAQEVRRTQCPLPIPEIVPLSDACWHPPRALVSYDGEENAIPFVCDNNFSSLSPTRTNDDPTPTRSSERPGLFSKSRGASPAAPPQ